MKTYTYHPPKLKPSAARIEVFDAEGKVSCTLQRVYPNAIAKVCTYTFDIDWSAQVQVFDSEDDRPLYLCKKETPWFGRPKYVVRRRDPGNEFLVVYTSWQKLAPEFKVSDGHQEYTLKKDLFGWARFMRDGEVLARWKMNPAEWFKTRVEIESACPIQEPAFFLALFHCIFYIGD